MKKTVNSDVVKTKMRFEPISSAVCMSAKSFIVLTCFAFSTFALAHNHEQAAASKKEKAANVESKAKESKAAQTTAANQSVKEGYDMQVDVEGMVCSFCAQGIEKKMKATEKVESVDVDMDKKMVYLKFKSKQSLNDEEITKVIVDSGVNVKSIVRKASKEPAKNGEGEKAKKKS